MAIVVGNRVNTPFGNGVVTEHRKDGGVNVVRRYICTVCASVMFLRRFPRGGEKERECPR